MTPKKFAISILLILGGTAVFVFGSPYYTIFPTNQNRTYYIVLTVTLLVLALAFKRFPALDRFWSAAYALFIASAALLFLDLGPFNLPRDESNPLQFLAIDKFSQFIHVVPVILLLTLLVGEDLKSIFIARGSLKRGLAFGLVSFVIWTLLAFWMGAFSNQFVSSLFAAAPWILVFIFSNAIMEELWFRGIFLKKYERLVGRRAAILVTALVFGASHINATYQFPGGGLVFGIVVFILGVVGAYAMLKDDSLIGPVLFHAGYDLLILVPILATV